MQPAHYARLTALSTALLVKSELFRGAGDIREAGRPETE